jgi:hypothetical protein
MVFPTTAEPSGALGTIRSATPGIGLGTSSTPRASPPEETANAVPVSGLDTSNRTATVTPPQLHGEPADRLSCRTENVMIRFGVLCFSSD